MGGHNCQKTIAHWNELGLQLLELNCLFSLSSFARDLLL